MSKISDNDFDENAVHGQVETSSDDVATARRTKRRPRVGLRTLKSKIHKALVIAEKPSVAKDIARVLRATRKQDEALFNDEYVITSALGHLVELPMPEEMGSQFKRWTLANLPIIPEKFQLKPNERTKDRLHSLKKWMANREIVEIINACDAGREGELIFTYIYEICKCKKPFRRLWMTSMTTEGINSAFENLRTPEIMLPLQEAARCRSEADWLVGINGTRAITVRTAARKSVASVGRVQTPTLAMVVERERSIRNFESIPYWRILGKFAVKNGEYDSVLQLDERSHDTLGGYRDRISRKEKAESILENLRQVNLGTVTEKKKRTKQSPPRLYDLTTLQREANTRFHYSAASTLKIAQALYDQHKLITYPRTDSKALPEDYAPVCERTLQAMGEEYSPFVAKITQEYGIHPSDKKIFNNAEISDHFAIIPTPQIAGKLNEEESRIYDMIVRRFIAIFFPQAEYDVTSRTTKVDGYTFTCEGKVLAEVGWLAVYDKKQEDSKQKETLPAIEDGDGDPPQAKVVSVEVCEEQTRPPAHYTEATLLSAMETAGRLVDDEDLALAMKDKGIGTPATRAQIIDNLIGTGYMERSDQRDRAILVTAKAERLIDFLNVAGIEILKNPSMTGEWEFKLREIEHGRFSRTAFMEEVTKLTKFITEKIKNFSETDAHNCQESCIYSPLDGKPLLESFRAYHTADRALTIAKVIGGKELNPEEVIELIRTGRIGPFEDFRSRAGKPFKASIVIEAGRTKLEFDGMSAEALERIRQALTESDSSQILCDCPMGCGGKVYVTDQGYLCENLQNQACTFRMSRMLLGHELTIDEFSSLIQQGKTPLIDNFISNRTGRYFSAYVSFGKEGRIEFEFPPRPVKKKVDAAVVKDEE
ncbi:MAG: DNA topoisomerase 3 [Puniceicoccales bacterium]|jgi:DNA topoisomerase-3|nr:DNA topoisomerase 3 [Puniceicoccales bacterium]